MSSGVLGLGLANALALLAAVAAAAVYARWLEPAEFAQWALALGLARAAQLLLDGGLKMALVRRQDAPSTAVLQRLVRISACIAVLLTLLAVLTTLAVVHSGKLDGASAVLFIGIPAAYLLSYPGLFAPLARLERAQRFGDIGRAEGGSVVLEFVLPVLGLWAGLPFEWAFAAAAVAARGLRTFWVRQAAGRLVDSGSDNAGACVNPSPRTHVLLKEAGGMQLVAGLSMLRDQMHLWLVLPWFGAHWAGQYGLALMACALASQVAVQTVARVSVPALRSTEPAAQWPQVLARLRTLALFTLPPLALLPAWMASLNTLAWDGRWELAVLIVPWLCLRMVAGVATTVLGSWLLVAGSPWRNAQAHAAWTACEAAAAVLALAVFGPMGLAISGALSAWFGIALFLHATRASVSSAGKAGWGPLLRTLLLRPSLAAVLALAGWVYLQPQHLLLATLLLPLAWLLEAPVRRWLRVQGMQTLLAARP